MMQCCCWRIGGGNKMWPKRRWFTSREVFLIPHSTFICILDLSPPFLFSIRAWLLNLKPNTRKTYPSTLASSRPGSKFEKCFFLFIPRSMMGECCQLNRMRSGGWVWSVEIPVSIVCETVYDTTNFSPSAQVTRKEMIKHNFCVPTTSWLTHSPRSTFPLWKFIGKRFICSYVWMDLHLEGNGTGLM